MMQGKGNYKTFQELFGIITHVPIMLLIFPLAYSVIYQNFEQHL